jgi:hypothetical protein
MPKTGTGKRPCTICRKWFLPDPRQIGRQQTCGNPACQKERHRRRCREWNRKNRDYFKANYLSAKLGRTRDPPVSSKQDIACVTPPSRLELCLPKKVMVEVISAEQLVVVEYLIEQIMGRAVAKSSLAAP